MSKPTVGSKCVNIAFIFRTSVGSINSSFTEENISIVKKVTLPDGKEIPYVSAQAIRRYIRSKWEEMGLKISPVHRVTAGGTASAGSECNPVDYIDDDLFGFMLAIRGETNKRTSPVRVSPAIAFFPFQEDRDLGVRITEEGKKDPTQMMPPFETEVYYNYFLCNILVDLERIGEFTEDNYGKKKPPKSIDVDNKHKRLKALIEAVHHLWGGGKQARFLTDISPKFIIYTRQSAKKPIFLERLEMKEDETIDVSSVVNALKDDTDLIERVIIGVADGFGGVSVGQKISYEKEATIETLSEAFAEIIKDATSAVN